MEAKSHTFLKALKLWLIWNIVADMSLVGFTILFGIPIFIGSFYPVSVSIPLLGLVLGSLSMGSIQWLAFRNRIKRAHGWILATTLGWSLIMVLLYLLLFSPLVYANLASYDIPYLVWVFIAGAIGGAVIGLLQWQVLRRHVPGAELWLEASILGWACAGGAAYALSQTSMKNLGGLVGVLTMGMITGVAYAYLFSQPSQQRIS